MYTLLFLSIVALFCICCSDYDGSALSNSVPHSSQEQTIQPPQQ
ncbi:MAG: hypothetical protein OCC49_10860 [Fibrobacterales bacterium]